LVTDSFVSASDAFAGVLAARAAIDRDLRRRAISRTIAVVAVVLLHILFLYLLLIAERFPSVRKPAVPHEVLLVLAPAERPTAAPRFINANPEKKRERVQEYEPAPINLPPVVAPPQQPADVMRALGVELACGASHYEYLNPVERKLCKHPPWKLPENRGLALAPPPPPQPGHMTGSEAAARERAQAPPCAPGLQVPCVDTIIYGKAPH
jgi:hypothetical protein